MLTPSVLSQLFRNETLVHHFYLLPTEFRFEYMKVNDSKITINIHNTKHKIIIFITLIILFCRHVNKVTFYSADRCRRKEMLIQIFKHKKYMPCCHLSYLRYCILALLRNGDVKPIFQKILSNARTSHLPLKAQ